MYILGGLSLRKSLRTFFSFRFFYLLRCPIKIQETINSSLSTFGDTCFPQFSVCRTSFAIYFDSVLSSHLRSFAGSLECNYYSCKRFEREYWYSLDFTVPFWWACFFNNLFQIDIIAAHVVGAFMNQVPWWWAVCSSAGRTLCSKKVVCISDCPTTLSSSAREEDICSLVIIHVFFPRLRICTIRAGDKSDSWWSPPPPAPCHICNERQFIRVKNPVVILVQRVQFDRSWI